MFFLSLQISLIFVVLARPVRKRVVAIRLLCHCEGACARGNLPILFVLVGAGVPDGPTSLLLEEKVAKIFGF